MQTKNWLLMAALGLFSAGCGGEEAVDTNDGSDTNDTQDDTNADTDVEDEAPPLEPVAVGLEFDGIRLADDSLVSYNTEIDGEVTPWGPYMILTFADMDYFSAQSSEDQEGHYCIALATLDDFAKRETDFPTKSMGEDDLAYPDNADLWVSYEGHLTIAGSTCENVAEGDYGAGAEDLLAAFDGAHIGMGFGAPTPYLTNGYATSTDADVQEFYTKYGPSMMAEYIAMNDADGNWIGWDWNLAYLFEWDAEGQALKSDDEGNLIPVDVSTIPQTDPLPEGYIRTSAFWYQDFPLLDFTNLEN